MMPDFSISIDSLQQSVSDPIQKDLVLINNNFKTVQEFITKVLNQKQKLSELIKIQLAEHPENKFITLLDWSTNSKQKTNGIYDFNICKHHGAIEILQHYIKNSDFYDIDQKENILVYLNTHFQPSNQDTKVSIRLSWDTSHFEKLKTQTQNIINHRNTPIDYELSVPMIIFGHSIHADGHTHLHHLHVFRDEILNNKNVKESIQNHFHVELKNDIEFDKLQGIHIYYYYLNQLHIKLQQRKNQLENRDQKPQFKPRKQQESLFVKAFRTSNNKFSKRHNNTNFKPKTNQTDYLKQKAQSLFE